MPEGTVSQVFQTIDPTCYVWGQQNGKFGRFQAQSFVAAVGAQGPPGTSSQWYSGSGAPTTGTVPSSVGNYYLDTATGNVWECAISGITLLLAWSIVVNIMGPTGATGPTGPAGSSYTVTNNTSASSDFALAQGDVAYVTYSAATNVLLHVATSQGLYEVVVCGVPSNSTSNTGTATLNANNTTQSGAWAAVLDSSTGSIGSGSGSSSFYGYEWAGTSSAILTANGGTVKAVAQVSTFTNSKTLSVSGFALRSPTVTQRETLQTLWNDTTTAWTSLGTITFPFAQSGTVVIRRII